MKIEIEMKVFKLLLIVGVVILSVQTFAQVKYGVIVGANVSNMKFDVKIKYGEEPETKVKMGFHIGFFTDILLDENTFSFQPALLYSKKGYSVDFEKMIKADLEEYDIEMENYTGYARMYYNYIELPLNFVYKNSGFQVSAGPYFAFGIGGNFDHDFSFEADGEVFESDDFFNHSIYDLKPVYGIVDDDEYASYLHDDIVWELYRAFDFGLSCGVGYQVGSFIFNIGYSYGLVNVTPDYDADRYNMDDGYTKGVIQKNRVFTFSASFLFK